jgi:hypothetical protein
MTLMDMWFTVPSGSFCLLKNYWRNVKINITTRPRIYLFFYIIFLLTVYYLFPSISIAQAGWTPDMRLTHRQGYSYDPRAACYGNTIHVVWWEGYADTMIHEEIFYKRSTDAGLTWGVDVLLSVEDSQTSIMPIVACSNQNVYVFWGEDGFGTLLRKSTDNGETWSLTDSILPGEFYRDIFIVNDTIFLAGARNPGDIIFRKSTNSGSSWLPLKIVGYGAYVREAVNPPVIGYVYQVARYCQEIMFKRSTDNGGTWSDSVIVSYYDSVGSQWAVIGIDTCFNIHTGWYDYKYSPYAWTGDIFYRESRDSGSTWQPIDFLTTQHRAAASDILAEGNNLHLVWEDDRNDFDDNFEIYYRLSRDLGQTWDAEVRLTDASNWSREPSLASDGNYLHLFWSDLRDDPNNKVGEIYYKRKNWLGITEIKTAYNENSGLKIDCPTIVKGSFPIRYDLGDNKTGTIALIDLSGRIVMRIAVDADCKETYITINQGVANGLYFLMLKSGFYHRIRKVAVLK